jgi:hypothetical protein
MLTNSLHYTLVFPAPPRRFALLKRLPNSFMERYLEVWKSSYRAYLKRHGMYRMGTISYDSFRSSVRYFGATIQELHLDSFSLLPRASFQSSSFRYFNIGGHGEGQLAVYGQKFYDTLTCPKAQHIIAAEEGGEAHCGVNNESLSHQIVFDWLDDVFKKNKA